MIPAGKFLKIAFWTGGVVSSLVLIGAVLLPPANMGQPVARATTAKNDATQIATAVSAYFTEYGRVPMTTGTDVTLSDRQQAHLMDVLDPPNSLPPPAENSRNITFLEIPPARRTADKHFANGRIDEKGPYLDPWGNPYLVLIDGNYDSRLQGPDPNGTPIRKMVLVWSKGSPNKSDYNDPTKWIKSWE